MRTMAMSMMNAGLVLALLLSLTVSPAAAAAPTAEAAAAPEPVPVHVARWSERLEVAEGGAADVRAEIRFAAAEEGPQRVSGPVPAELLIPLPFPDVERATARFGDEDLVATVETVEGQRRLRVDLRPVRGRVELGPEAAPVTVGYHTDAVYGAEGDEEGGFSTLRRRYAFRNATAQRIHAYDMTIALPAGRAVHRIEESVPPLNPKAPTRPFGVRNDSARDGAELHMACAPLGPGDRCALVWTTRPTSRSFLPIAIALALAALFAWRFRAVLKPQD